MMAPFSSLMFLLALCLCVPLCASGPHHKHHSHHAHGGEGDHHHDHHNGPHYQPHSHHAHGGTEGDHHQDHHNGPHHQPHSHHAHGGTEGNHHHSHDATRGFHAHHSHGHTSKERVGDGAYSPRDHAHFEKAPRDAAFDHEAILGSVKEAQEFDEMPADVAKERLRGLLQLMDLNGDGLVSKEELKAWILRSFSKLSREENQERFSEVDEDGDGRVTWKEYVLDTFGDESDMEEEISNSDERHELRLTLDEDHILFRAADKDGDGSLNEEEMLSFTHPEEDPQMHQTIIQQVLLRKDKNGDGKIEFKEFLSDQDDIEESKDKAWLIAEKVSFEEEYDKDKDGFLAGDEIIGWIVPDNEETAQDEVNHLFAVADEDHDEMLSVQEVLDNHEIFVGSEATDFGGQLHDEL